MTPRALKTALHIVPTTSRASALGAAVESELLPALDATAVV